MIGLPSAPKLSDVVTALGEVATRLDTIEARMNELTKWRDEHEVSKVARQQQVDAALAELRRMRGVSPT